MTLYVLKTIIGLSIYYSEPISLSECLKQKYELQNYYAHHNDNIERTYQCSRL